MARSKEREANVRIEYVSDNVSNFEAIPALPNLRTHYNHRSINHGPLPMKFKMLGFQDQEDGVKLESEQRSVGTYYVSSGAFGSVTYSPPTKLQRNTSSSKFDILNGPLPMKFKMLGFQDQEDGVKLEIEERSVDQAYVSTANFG